MLLILLLYAAARVSADCVPAPFRVAIENVTLDNRQTARGLSLTLGTPPQPFAFLPQWYVCMCLKKKGYRQRP